MPVQQIKEHYTICLHNHKVFAYKHIQLLTSNLTQIPTQTSTSKWTLTKALKATINTNPNQGRLTKPRNKASTKRKSTERPWALEQSHPKLAKTSRGDPRKFEHLGQFFGRLRPLLLVQALIGLDCFCWFGFGFGTNKSNRLNFEMDRKSLAFWYPLEMFHGFISVDVSRGSRSIFFFVSFDGVD